MNKAVKTGLMVGVSISGWVALGIPTNAQAAEERPAASSTSDEIIVTARRKAERMIDVPASITVISADTLKARGISSATDLVHAVPSLQQSSAAFGNATPHFMIRGQRQAVEFIQSDQSVGVYVDEVAVPRMQGLNAGMFDVQAVQVLKGPQGTLFGKNQTGGAILFTSQMPKSEFGGYVSATIGNYQARKIEGAINVPLTDSLQIRAAGQIDRRDGYLHNVTDGRGYSDVNTDGWRVSAHFEPKELPLENWLIVSGATENEIGPGAKFASENLGVVSPGVLPVGTTGIFKAFGNPAGDALYSAAIQSQVRSYGRWEIGGVSQFQLPDGNNVEITNFAVTNKAELHLGDNTTLRNIAGYRFLRSYQSANIAGTAGYLLKPGTTASTATISNLLVTPSAPLPGDPVVPVPAGNVICGPQSGINCVIAGFNALNFTRQRQISDELSLLGKALDGRIDYIVGGYYFREHGQHVTGNFAPVSNGSRMQLSQSEPANQSVALFSQVTWRIIPTVAITAGLRQTWDKREQVSRSVVVIPDYFTWKGGLLPANGIDATCLLSNNAGRLPNDTASSPNNCYIAANANFSKLTYTASIDWHPMPDMLVYATTRTGYRSGGFNPGATVNTTAAPTVSTPFRPETITDVEIGFKGNWRWDNGMSARFNVAGYHDAYNNIQRSLSTSTAGGQKLVTANAASATIKGVEVEAGFEPTNWLEISGYYSYIDAKFKKFVINDPVSFNAASQGDFSKSAFSGLPTHSGGASLTLHDDLADNRGRLSASLDYYGQTSIYMQDNNFLTTTQTFVAADRLPGYWLLGANISWSNVMGKSVDLAFNIRNILNKRYATGGSDALTAGLGSIVQFIGEPRMFTFNLTYNF